MQCKQRAAILSQNSNQTWDDYLLIFGCQQGDISPRNLWFCPSGGYGLEPLERYLYSPGQLPTTVAHCPVSPLRMRSCQARWQAQRRVSLAPSKDFHR